MSEDNDVLLLDVTPLTLSIETVGGVATPLIQETQRFQPVTVKSLRHQQTFKHKLKSMFYKEKTTRKR